MINFRDIATENEELIQKTESKRPFTNINEYLKNGLLIRRAFPFSQEYTKPPEKLDQIYDGDIILEMMPTDEAIVVYSDYKVMALNFANRSNPGGGYIYGARAQEESLCRQYPYLYSGLCCHSEETYPIKGIIVSENVPRHRKEDFTLVQDPSIYASFVTCAAPMVRLTQNPFDENKEYIEDMLELIFTVPASKGYDVLVVGAWGCGAFAPHDPKKCLSYVTKMAATMRMFAETYKKFYKHIVFAIPNDKNYDIFKQVLY